MTLNFKADQTFEMLANSSFTPEPGKELPKELLDEMRETMALEVFTEVEMENLEALDIMMILEMEIIKVLELLDDMREVAVKLDNLEAPDGDLVNQLSERATEIGLVIWRKYLEMELGQLTIH